ncbi:Hypothetical protein EIN_241030, partial [Entamoeba invadens IP1]
CGYSPL